jgi:hypothetical protein
VRPLLPTIAALAAWLAVASACRRTPPEVDSCRAPLGGVWLARSGGALAAAPLRGDERLGFDVRDEGKSLLLYPLWDSSRPAGAKPPLSTDPSAPPAPLVLSPWRLTLTRAGDAAVGTIRFRVTQAGRTCPVEQPARLSACHGRHALLELTLATSVDASTCALATPPTRLGFALTRQ